MISLFSNHTKFVFFVQLIHRMSEHPANKSRDKKASPTTDAAGNVGSRPLPTFDYDSPILTMLASAGQIPADKGPGIVFIWDPDLIDAMKKTNADFPPDLPSLLKTPELPTTLEELSARMLAHCYVPDTANTDHLRYIFNITPKEVVSICAYMIELVMTDKYLVRLGQVFGKHLAYMFMTHTRGMVPLIY